MIRLIRILSKNYRSLDHLLDATKTVLKKLSWENPYIVYLESLRSYIKLCLEQLQLNNTTELPTTSTTLQSKNSPPGTKKSKKKLPDFLQRKYRIGPYAYLRNQSTSSRTKSSKNTKNTQLTQSQEVDVLSITGTQVEKEMMNNQLVNEMMNDSHQYSEEEIDGIIRDLTEPPSVPPSSPVLLTPEQHNNQLFYLDQEFNNQEQEALMHRNGLRLLKDTIKKKDSSMMWLTSEKINDMLMLFRNLEN